MQPPRQPRRFLVDEVVQTSATDCGPAALKSLLNGFGVSVSYDSLREACHTDVDGTSIDTLEEVACELGLEAEQIIIPPDHVLLPAAEALPAIVVVRNPDGAAHFVVAWRRHGRLVQVMDPARGRIWIHEAVFVNLLFSHSLAVPTVQWRQWAATDAFLHPLDRRLSAFGLSVEERTRYLAGALQDPSWRSLAALDAAVRLVVSLRSNGAVSRRSAQVVLAGLMDDPSRLDDVPDGCWSVREAPNASDGSEQVTVRGAVLVRALRRNDSPARENSRSVSREAGRARRLNAALHARPLREVMAGLWEDGALTPAIAAVAALLATTGIVFEAILLRSALDIGTFLRPKEQLWGAGLALVAFAVIVLGLEIVLASAERRLGRRIEARLRLALLEKIPRLPDTYFRSRPLSDLLERSHSVHTIRQLPVLGCRIVRLLVEVALTAIALSWLNPQLVVPAIVGSLAAVGIPLLASPMFAERDLRLRTHSGALARFHLDALLGRTAIEAHGALPAIEREHEIRLVEWADSSLRLQRTCGALEGIQMLAGLAVAAWMLFGARVDGGTAGVLILQMFWTLNLPALGYELAICMREYPACRSTVLRLLEPLRARDGGSETTSRGSTTGMASTRAAEIHASRLSIVASGQAILHELDLAVPRGSHVAIVGASGAGKSTLLGALLGWYEISSGELVIDGERIDRCAYTLRNETAWVDPTVHLWNRSLLENLMYGNDNADNLGAVLEMTGLLSIVGKLPDGLASVLGEAGAVLSTGEAQCVRLARAMLKRSPRLVLLDEPFAGIERDRRRMLLSNARRHWRDTTLLYVTHDIAESRLFDRVIVLERGAIVENGNPQALVQSSSRYRWLLQAQERVNAQLAGPLWRHICLASGQVVHDHATPVEQTA